MKVAYLNSFLFPVILIFCSSTSVGQIKISGIIVDAETKKAISYATVINVSIRQGVYSTVNGEFELLVNKGDSIKLSCVGYNPINICYKLSKNNEFDTFYLTRRSHELTKVFVSPVDWSRYKEKKMGYAGTKSYCHVVGVTGLEYAIYIPNTKKILDAYIYELQYKIRKFKPGAVAIRLHLYAVNSDNSPSVELLDSNYVETLAGEMDKIISFNISPLKIKLPPDGIFIGIEWLGTYDPNTNSIFSEQVIEPMIGFNFKSEDSITFERRTNENWERSDVRKLFIGSWLEKEMLSENIPNPSFGITIKIPK